MINIFLQEEILGVFQRKHRDFHRKDGTSMHISDGLVVKDYKFCKKKIENGEKYEKKIVKFKN